MKYSVIMPVYLGNYPTRGSNPVYKFKRAVTTFLLQTYKDAELIIISDGCNLAESIFNELFLPCPRVHFRKIRKQPSFGGRARQTGIEMAQGEIICYLDADDMFGPNHLQILNNNFDITRFEWAFYNDYLVTSPNYDLLERNIMPIPCYIGTSCIVHKKSLGAVWGDGYGHDWAFIRDYLFLKQLGTKIRTPEYYVSHIPGGYDF